MTTATTENNNTEQQQTQEAPEGEATEQAAPEEQAPKDSLIVDVEDPKPLAFEKGVKPEGIPDDAWDETTGEVKVEALFQAYQNEAKRAKGLRDKLAKGGDKAPKDPSEYKLEFAEEIKAVIPDNDPLVEAGRKIAQKNGLSQEQFQGFMSEMAGEVAKLRSQIEQPEAPSEAEIQEYREAEFKKLGANGKAVARAVSEWARQMKDTGAISEADHKLMQSFATSADAIRLLNTLRSMTTQNSNTNIPLDSTIDDGLPSDHEIYAMIGSKKYQDGDPVTLRKVEDLLAKREAAGRPARLQV